MPEPFGDDARAAVREALLDDQHVEDGRAASTSGSRGRVCDRGHDRVAFRSEHSGDAPLEIARRR